MITIRTNRLLYVAGPITADKEARTKFTEATKKLTEAGYGVVDPMSLDPGEYFPGFKDMPSEEKDVAQLKADLIVMLRCDGVATLPMDHSSRGMARELAIAFSLDIPVFPVDAWIEGGVYE